jgi:hypothetical protein
MEHLRRAEANRIGIVSASRPDCFNVAVGRQSLDRLERFLGELAARAEARGFRTVPAADGLPVLIDRDTVSLMVREELDRPTHIPTLEEIPAVRALDRERDRKVRAGLFVSSVGGLVVPPPREREGGRLVVLLEQVYAFTSPSLRRRFADGKKQKLEKLVDSLLEAIARSAAAKRDRAAFYEQAKRELEEGRLAAEHAEHNASLDQRRVAALDEILQGQQRLEVLETLLEALASSAGQDPSSALQPFVSWARSYAAKLRAELTPLGLTEAIAKTGLFPAEHRTRDLSAR